ncbi:MAG: helix-turn-helix domain-containing protein [Propionibacteriaceae bacterium]|jgi:hypothetical protein|nr:helix-turn-helix domain-containing protein [Propionibacteriaceae bacterium]
MAKTLYSVERAAREFSMSQARVRALCLSGAFGFKEGKVWLISHESITAWIRKRDEEEQSDVSDDYQRYGYRRSAYLRAA